MFHCSNRELLAIYGGYSRVKYQRVVIVDMLKCKRDKARRIHPSGEVQRIHDAAFIFNTASAVFKLELGPILI